VCEALGITLPGVLFPAEVSCWVREHVRRFLLSVFLFRIAFSSILFGVIPLVNLESHIRGKFVR